jgi:peptidoglycan/xylan/chitin deacetylase (PgdA/CDA1 family)
VSARARGDRRSPDDVIVLCYHGIAPDGKHGQTTPEALRRQLAYLEAQGYRFTTFSDAVLGAVEGKVAAVTFDDGIASALEFGLPVLGASGAQGTMFPRLDTLGTHGRVTAADLCELRARGWEVGSHTVSHPDLTRLADAELELELEASRDELERLLGIPCISLAYPLGRVDRRVADAAAAAGYVAGAALEGASSVPRGPLAWPRVGIRGDDSMHVFSIKCSRLVRAARSSPARRPMGALATFSGRARRAIRLRS